MAEIKEIVYKRSNDYRIIPVSGAWGGATPQSDLCVELYVEHVTYPEKEIIKKNELTNQHKAEPQGEQKLVRELQVGLLLRADIAYNIGNWLINKAEQLGVVAPPDDKKEE
jgi:hypothetical protein